MNTDGFWSDTPEILFKKNRLSEFYITNDMTVNEKLNAIVRFFIYSSILCVLYTNNPKYILLIVFALVFTYFIKSNSTENFDCNDPIDSPTQHSMDTTHTTDDDIVPVKPTINNPFMNPSIFDDITKFKATDYSDNTPESNEVKKDIYNKFSYNLYKDVDDIFDVNNNFRGFNTVPNPVINYDKFLKYVYGDFNKGAKETTYDGFKNNYENLKSQRQIT
jgi:hypothetical protein